jgi:hypothetical protein
VDGIHRFQTYKFDAAHLRCCGQIRDGCLKAWQLTAAVYIDRVPETGFNPTGLGAVLAEFGVANLPPTPDRRTITRNPYFTDISEVVGLELLSETEPSLTIPVVRTYHKEWTGAQHRGIDLLAFSSDGSGEYSLFIIEVMASDEDRHPPTTVGSHRHQLLDETLNEASLERLRKDLSYVHAESEDKYKPIWNGFIATLIKDREQLAAAVVAAPILIRPGGLLALSDSRPFQAAKSDFEGAVVGSRILFKGVDCGVGFVELFSTIRATMGGTTVGAPGVAS